MRNIFIVFEDKQYPKIEKDAEEHQQKAGNPGCQAQHALRQGIIDENASCNDRHIAWVIVAVEYEGGDNQESLVEGNPLRQPAQQEIDNERDGQEGKNENIRIEKHGELL